MDQRERQEQQERRSTREEENDRSVFDKGIEMANTDENVPSRQPTSKPNEDEVVLQNMAMDADWFEDGRPDSGRAGSDSSNDELHRTRRSGVCGCVDCVRDCVHAIFPPGGILSSALTMASGAIGAGILGLPGATNSVGLVLTVIYLVIFSTVTVFSLRMVAEAAHKVGVRNFEGILEVLFPRWHHAFSYFAAFIRWFFSLGCCVGYVISTQDLFKPIFDEASNRQQDNASLQYLKSVNGRRLMAFLIWLCFMLPLVIPKHIDSLRYASFAAIAFMCYFCIIIIVHSCLHGLPEHKDKVRLSGKQGSEDGDYIYLFRTGNTALGELGTFFFSYVIHGNAVEVYFDMNPEVRSVNGMTKAAAVGMLITFCIYLFVCIFGYFDFGANKLATNSLLLMYNPLEEVEVMVAYVGVLVKLCVAYALMHLGARNAVYYACGWTKRYKSPRAKMSVQRSEPDRMPYDDKGDGVAYESQDMNDGCAACGITAEELEELRDDHAAGTHNYVDNIPTWQHLLVVGCLSSVCLLLGLFIPSINIVFGFAGSICGGFMAFIFPSLAYMYCGSFTYQKVGWLMYIMTHMVLVMGVVGVVFGTGSAIYGLASK